MTVYKYAGFWRRAVAYSTDNIIINVIFTILFIICLIATYAGAASGDKTAWLTELMDPARISLGVLVIIALYFIISIGYFTFFHGLNGRTPGKMIMGLQVLSTEGTPITFGISFLRAVGYIISGLVLNIGFIWAAFDGRKQGWHDKIAGTVVIIRPRENEFVGLTIPQPSPTLDVPPAQVLQQATDSPSTAQPVTAADAQNRGDNSESKP